MKQVFAACWLAVGTTSVALAAPASASARDWDRASSAVRTGVVAFSFGVPAVEGDWRGLQHDALALGVAAAVTGGLKLASHERRPDGSDERSFPSGHTSISFAAAAGLEQRYGWKLGLPAHLAAAFVGLGRIKAQKHYLHDVLVGAAVGEAAGLLLVRKRHASQSAPIMGGFTIAF